MDFGSRVERVGAVVAERSTVGACGLELSVPRVEDVLVAVLEPRWWGDVPNRAAPPFRLVGREVARRHADSLVERERHARPNAFGLKRVVPALDRPIRLRIVGRRADVRHLREADELLPVRGDERRAVVREDARPGHRESRFRALQGELDVRLGHRRAELPVHDVVGCRFW